MIFKCNCGALKTGQPYRASGQSPWICSKCESAKGFREGSRAAQDRNGGRSYPLQHEPRNYPAR